jgi:hypothetical protein
MHFFVFVFFFLFFLFFAVFALAFKDIAMALVAILSE